MDGHTRRENLRQRLQGAKTPISGAVLAAAFQVSRQVIVQDIALLRAQDVPVISTNRGYLILGEACRVHRFKVRHDLSRMEEELNIFVDAGATVRNVTIDHPVYGTLEGKLNLSSRRDVQRFMKAIRAHPEAPRPYRWRRPLPYRGSSTWKALMRLRGPRGGGRFWLS